MYRKFLALVVCCAVMVGVAQAGQTVNLRGNNNEAIGNGRLGSGTIIYKYANTNQYGNPGWTSNPYNEPAYVWNSAGGNVLNVLQGDNSFSSSHTISGFGNTFTITSGSIAGGTLTTGSANSIITNNGGTTSITNIQANGVSNRVNLNDGTTSSNITLGTTAQNNTNADQKIKLAGGTNSGAITAYGDKTELILSEGSSSNTILLHGCRQDIDYTAGSNNNVNITATGSNHTVDFAGGTSGGSITTNGNHTVVTVDGASTTTTTELKLGAVSGAGNNEINLKNGTNSGKITAEGETNKFILSGGTSSNEVDFRGGDNTVLVEGGTYKDKTIKMVGGNNEITVKTSGDLSSTSTIEAGKGDNTLSIEGGTAQGSITLGADSDIGSNIILLSAGSNSGTITAAGDKNSVEINNGDNSGSIILSRNDNTIEINTTGAMSGSIDAQGGKNNLTITDTATVTGDIHLGAMAGEINTVLISGGNTSGDITVDGDGNKFTIEGGSTSSKIHFTGSQQIILIDDNNAYTGATSIDGGGNDITIDGGTNSGSLEAKGNTNKLLISDGNTSTAITLGKDNADFGRNEITVTGGVIAGPVVAKGSLNIYDQSSGTVTQTSVIDLGQDAGVRGTKVEIYGDSKVDGKIIAHDGTIHVYGKDAKITGDISADNAGGHATWNLEGGNFDTNSHLTSVADASHTNTFLITKDANFSNVKASDVNDAAIKTSGEGTTVMTIMEMLESNGKAISGRITLATATNELKLLGGAHITKDGVLDIRGGTKNTITFNLTDDNGGTWVEGVTGFKNYDFKNLLDLTDPNTIKANNTVNILSGKLDRDEADGESIRGAGKVGSTIGTTYYNIEGGTTRYINTNSGKGILDFKKGIFNLTDPMNYLPETPVVKVEGQAFNTRDKNVLKETLDPDNKSTATFADGNFLVYTLLNIGDTVTVEDGATVTIGVIDYLDNAAEPANRYDFKAASVASLDTDKINNDASDADSLGYDYRQHAAKDENNKYLEAQISAKNVMVKKNGTLIIHENWNNWGDYSPEDDTKNIIDNLTIQGEIDFDTGITKEGHVTLDRTSIHGSSSDAMVHVNSYGYLHGFGYYESPTDPTDHTPRRENVDGNIVLGTGFVRTTDGSVYRGGTLQPYNPDIFKMAAGEKNEEVVKKLMGVVFKASGDIEFKNTSFLSTRLFHQNDTADSSRINIDGAVNQLHYSDSVVSGSFTFSDVWNPASSKDIPLSTSLESKIHQGKKVQYDPVFGFNYELKSKLAFKLYQGLPGSNEKTYYYKVASADDVIAALQGLKADKTIGDMPDANHLFNRNILKSDMLGEWTFLYTETGKDIVLRFRLLADHPQNGGFVVDETERNNILVGKYLDEIRYPFLTNSKNLNLPGDYAGDIAGLTDDKTLDIRDSDGTVDPDKQSYGGQGFSGNLAEWYRDETTRPGPASNWNDDWMRDWEDMFTGIQLDIQSGTDMRRGLRSLHAESYANVASSNFTVLSQFIRNRERNAISALYQVEADLHKKAEDDGIIMKDGMEWHVPIIEQDELPFVENPIRFWASGFGQSGYVRNSGTEYGYDLESWGGAVGVIKEFRNFYGGLTIGYADTKSTWDNLPSAGKTKSYMAEALVGMHFWDRYFVEGYFDYAYGEQTMNRSVDFGAGYYTGEATGDFVDHTYAGGLRLGFQSVLLDKYVFVATVGAQVMSYTNNGFTERGRETMASLLKIKKGSMDRTIFKTPVTVRLSRPFALGGWVMTPEVRASFSPYFGDREGILEGAEWRGNPFPGRTFNSYGTKHGKYEAEVGATIELSRRGRFYLAGNYDMTYTKNSIMHNYSLQAGLNF